MSFLNGLSAMGASIAQFAGAAGLEQQKADLAAQNLTLADTLTGARETAGRAQAADIADKAQSKQNVFTASESSANRGSLERIATGNNAATIGSAQIGAAATLAAQRLRSDFDYAQLDQQAPEAQARTFAQRQQTALSMIQTQNATDLRDLHTQLVAEQGKDAPDAGKVQSLTTQITSLEKSAASEAAVTTANVAMYKADVDAVEHLNTQVTAATAALNAPEMSDTDRTAQKALIVSLNRQLAGARRAMEMSSQAVHSRVATASGAIVPPATASDRPPLSTFATPTGAKPAGAASSAVPPPASKGSGYINGLGAAP